MSGCARNDPAPNAVKLATPVVIETSAIRCPAIAGSTLNEASRTTRPPDADISVNGTPALSDEAKAQWLDAHERAELRKNAALKGLIADYDTCRQPGKPSSTATDDTPPKTKPTT